MNNKENFLQNILSWCIGIILGFIISFYGYYYCHKNSHLKKTKTHLIDFKKDTKNNFHKINSKLDEIKDMLTQIDITKEE